MRLLGYVEITEATAGTWATAATKLQPQGYGVPRPGDIVGEAIDVDASQQQTTSGSDQVTNLSIAITLQDACNVVEVGAWTSGRFACDPAGAGATGIYKIKRGATTIANTTIGGNGNGAAGDTGAWGQTIFMEARELVPAVGSATYNLSMVSDGASTIYAQFGSGTQSGRIKVQELMA
jgi:hypothetical protein